jgi:putative ABC transport system permease protein
MTLFYLNLLLGLLLLIIPGYLLFLYDRLLCRHAAAMVLRMLVQLGVMGGVLWCLWYYDSVWFNLLWLVVLVVAGAFIVASRTRLRSRVLMLPVIVSMFVSVLLVTLYLLYVVLRPEQPMNVRWFVPVTGILMAHVLTTNIRVLRTYFDSLHQDSQPYYTLLGNGATRLQALTPYLTRALRSIVTPALATMSAMGLFVVPMLLSGLLTGGLDPVSAVTFYIILMVASIATSVLSMAITLWMSDRRAFTPQGKLGDIFE